MVQPGQRLRDQQESGARCDEFDCVAGGFRSMFHGGSRPLPDHQRFVERPQELFVRQIVDADFIDCGEDVVFRHDHDGRFLVELDGVVRPRVVVIQGIRQPGYRHLYPPVADGIGACGDVDRDEFESHLR